MVAYSGCAGNRHTEYQILTIYTLSGILYYIVIYKAFVHVADPQFPVSPTQGEVGLEIPVQEARRDVDVSGPKQICLRPNGEDESRVVYLSVHHMLREGATRCVITARLKDAGVAGEAAHYVLHGFEAMGKRAHQRTFCLGDFFFAQVVASTTDAAEAISSPRAVRDALLKEHVVPGFSSRMACALSV